MRQYENLGPTTTPFTGVAYACTLCGSLIIESDDPRHTPAMSEARSTHTLYHEIQTIGRESEYNTTEYERDLTYEDYELETDGSWSNTATDFPATPTETNLLNYIDTLENTIQTISELIKLYKTTPDAQNTITNILQQIEEINEDND
jgi:hypothetical protein